MRAYEGHEFETLKVQYQEHAEYMRAMNIFDWKIVSGFMTVQLVLGGWFAGHPSDSIVLSLGVIIIDLALYLCCATMLHISSERRLETLKTIHNINEALGLSAKGVFLQDKAINAQTAPGQRYIWYYVSMLIATAGMGFILVWNVPH